MSAYNASQPLIKKLQDISGILVCGILQTVRGAAEIFEHA